MILDYRGVDGAKFSACLIQSGTGNEAAEEFGHAVDAPILHGRGKMMRAGNNVGNDFCIRRIGDGGLEEADDRGRPIAEAAASPDGLTNDGRITLDGARP